MQKITKRLKRITTIATTVFLVLAMFASLNPALVVYAADLGMDFDIVTQVQEYGMDVTHVIIDTGQQVKAKSLDLDTFSVNAENIRPTNGTTAYEGQRAITDIYVNDENSIDGSTPVGQYIVLELSHGFTVTGASAIYYSGVNYKLDLNYSISQNKDFDLTRNAVVRDGQYVQDDTISPVLDDFDLVEFNDQKLRVYAPEADEALPLVIWNHGAGETYRPTLSATGEVLMDNEGAQLYANEGGVAWVQDEYPCYVIAPQREWGTNVINYSRANVMAYVDELVAQGKVDRSRIYVGGCSAGGGETYRYLNEYSEYFAAALPVCPAGTISTEMAEKVKDIPMWFFHSSDDTTIPVASTQTDVATLEAAGASEVLFTQPDHVTYSEFGVDGTYPGHWSWIIPLNNYYSDEYGTDVFDWLFSQQLGMTFDVIAQVQEYGMDVTHLIIDAGEKVESKSLDLDTFDVSALNIMPTTGNVAFDGEREITDIYVNDEPSIDGEETVGEYIVIELKYGFTVTGASALYYSMVNYNLDLNYEITQNKDFVMTSNAVVSDGEYTQGTVRKLIVDDFDLVNFNGQQMRVYAPESDEALPLVLWNHGFGETYYPTNGVGNEGVQIMANEGGVAWVQDEYPCYVLAPQRELGDGPLNYSRANVIAYIDELIAQGKVDGDHVYVAGCSAGGAETYNYLEEDASHFAAALPICPGGRVDVVRAETMNEVPMWFFHSADDTTIPVANTQTSVATLEASGATEVLYTEAEHVNYSEFGVDGTYPGHWSWIIPLNNYYSNDYQTNVFDWLFAH